MVTGTSVQDRILPRGVSDKQAVHFGNVALEDTNTLPTLKIKHRSDSYVQDLEGMVVCARNVHQSEVSGGAVWGRFRRYSFGQAMSKGAGISSSLSLFHA